MGSIVTGTLVGVFVIDTFSFGGGEDSIVLSVGTMVVGATTGLEPDGDDGTSTSLSLATVVVVVVVSSVDDEASIIPQSVSMQISSSAQYQLSPISIYLL